MPYGGLHKHHPFYMAWCNMKSRCNNPKATQYHWYGARGIKVCKSWKSFENFYLDMFSSWRPGLSLDRVDNNSGYSKDNCRWTSSEAQSNNRRPKTLRSHCLRGHELTDENTLIISGYRTCKKCREMSIKIRLIISVIEGRELIL